MAKRPQFDADTKPIFALDPPTPLTYIVYIRPRPAKQKIGLIHTAKRTRDAELAVRTVGEVIAIGNLAWKAKTPDLDLSQDPVAASIKVGDWVQYRQGAGQRLRVQRSDERLDTPGDEADDQWILAMSETDILGKFRDEAHAAKWYDWVA